MVQPFHCIVVGKYGTIVNFKENVYIYIYTYILDNVKSANTSTDDATSHNHADNTA